MAPPEKFAALSSTNKLTLIHKRLSQNRAKIAALRQRRAAEPPEVAAGRIAGILTEGPQLHRTVRRRLNLTPTAMTAAISHGVQAGLFRAESRPTRSGVNTTWLHPIKSSKKYNRDMTSPGFDEGVNSEFRRLAQEHFDKLSPDEQEQYRPKLTQFLNVNHMGQIAGEMFKRGGNKDDANDLALRMLYGGVSQEHSPLFAAHDLSKRSYFSRFIGYRDSMIGQYRNEGFQRSKSKYQPKLFSEVDREPEEGEFSQSLHKGVSSADLTPANDLTPEEIQKRQKKLAHERMRHLSNAATQAFRERQAALSDDWHVDNLASRIKAAGANGLTVSGVLKNAHGLTAARLAKLRQRLVAEGHAVERARPSIGGKFAAAQTVLYSPEHDPGESNPRQERLKQVAELMQRGINTPTAIKRELGLKTRSQGYDLIQQVKAKKYQRDDNYSKVPYFSDLLTEQAA